MALRVIGPSLIAASLAAAAVAAQAPNPPLPPRDVGAAASRTGTAVIRGHVVDGQTGRALRRVRITLTAPELGREGLSTSTDTDGFYELTELPAGWFTLTAQRSGYLQLRYGQRRPLEQGKPVELGEGQVLENADFALPRMGVISGRVTDELGEPIANVWVSAQRFIYRDNRRRLMPDGPIVMTDDDGEYRIAGLVPGTYLVNARTLEKWTVNERGREETTGYAPTFFPGLTDANLASRVTVTTGQVVAGIDVSLVPGRAATIAGTAVDSRGQPASTVVLVHELMGTAGGLVGIAGRGTVAPDGRFEISGVPPGEYTLQAAGSQESVALPIAVNGVDIANVGLTASAGWSLRGTVAIDSDAPAGLRRNQVTIASLSLAGRTPMRVPGGAVPRQVVNDDWTFSVTGVVGAARLRVTVPEGWAVKAVLHGDRDIADRPLDLMSGEELAGVQVVLTDRVATVTGQVVDQNGTAGPDGTVLLFPADSAKWYEGSRFIRATRPDQRGRYRIQGVLPGDYWLAALDYVEDGIWNDPEYLNSIRRDAQRVALVDAAPHVLPLKVVAP
ncbi:MAG: carboxypeptidase regulatory-like domain-containing protein [Acidobacteria bacterium]|nr:carboxypeptidase regulatory-like domain-containing protein [Acidobacteriota bacterium]